MDSNSDFSLPLEDFPIGPAWSAAVCREPPEHAGLVYFTNEEENFDSWTHPAFKMPENWIEGRDNQGRAVFYRGSEEAQVDAAAVTFEDPRGPEVANFLSPFSRALPGFWSLRFTPEGIIYFADSRIASTSWTDPRNPLPKAWRQKRDEAGKSFFINENTGEFQHEDPRQKLKEGWVMKSEFRGIYYERATPSGPEASWVDPRDPLPQGWTMQIDTKGKSIIRDKNNRIVAEDPREPKKNNGALKIVAEVDEPGSPMPPRPRKAEISSNLTSPTAPSVSILFDPSDPLFHPPGSNPPPPSWFHSPPVHSNTRFSSRYEKIQKISQGAFGQIFQVKRKTENLTNSPRGSSYALKLLKATQDAKHELALHKSFALHSPFIVRFHEGFQDNSEVALVLQICKGGNLFDFIETHKARCEQYEKSLPGAVAVKSPRSWLPAYFYLPESLILQWAVEIFLAVGKIHAHSIIHGDLKPENLFLSFKSADGSDEFFSPAAQRRSPRNEENCPHCSGGNPKNPVKIPKKSEDSETGNFLISSVNQRYWEFSRRPEHYYPPEGENLSRPVSGKENIGKPVKNASILPPIGKPGGNSNRNNQKIAFSSPRNSQFPLSPRSQNSFNASPREGRSIPSFPHYHAFYHHYHIQLGDFGLSTSVAEYLKQQKYRREEEFQGTPAFLSPEMFKNQNVQKKTQQNEISNNKEKAAALESEKEGELYKMDNWAIGVILYYLCCLRLPFGSVEGQAMKGEQFEQEFYALRKKVLKEQPIAPIPNCYSQDLQSLIMSLLAKKTRFRPQLSALLAAPYCQKWIQMYRKTQQTQ